jgi:hypothetical protein
LFLFFKHRRQTVEVIVAIQKVGFGKRGLDFLNCAWLYKKQRKRSGFKLVKVIKTYRKIIKNRRWFTAMQLKNHFFKVRA